jgi:hypothetical protein
MQMVNARFPATAGYGFEMVDAPDAAVSMRNRHQSKIYTESNQSDFSQVFGDLSSIQTLAIYRRLLVKETDCGINRNGNKTDVPGSRDVFSASHGILARAGARAVAQREDA